MSRLAALCASSVLVVGCASSSGIGLRGSAASSSSAVSAVPSGRTISYRASSFTDPTLDVSPDGRRLYFAAMGEIYVVPIGGGLAEQLPLGGAWKFRPAISPDGLSIAFLSDRGGGIAAWRSPLSMNRPATGKAVPGYEANTLTWVDDTSVGSTGGSTSTVSAYGLSIDYEGAHGSAHQSAQGDGRKPTQSGPSVSMSADNRGNVFIHRFQGIVRIDASTGIEAVVVPKGDNPVSQPRVTSDGTWLGFARTSGGTAHLMLKNLASGEVRNSGCSLNRRPHPGTFAVGNEPAYAFIPGQQAVVLVRDGRFHRCTFDGVEAPIPVEADVKIVLAPRIRPSPEREHAASGLPLDLASTADGRNVAFSDAGHLWTFSSGTGQVRRISTSEAYERSPAFSADGRRLAYVERFQDESSNLRMLDLTTGKSDVLLRSREALGNPAWSPDGRRIAFVEKPVTSQAEATLRWVGLDGSKGLVGQVTNRSIEAFPRVAWDRSGIALLYTQEGAEVSLISHPLGGEPHTLLSADTRVWDIQVSPSQRFVALKTRDGIYITPILLSSTKPPTFTWTDIRSMKRLWLGGADNLQWLADDRLVWTVQHKLMRALPGEAPREIADISVPLEPAARTPRRAFVGATVISMDVAGTIDDAVIVTNGRTLEYVGPRQGAPNLTGIKATDLSGKWIVPGFVDVHAHNFVPPLSDYNLPVGQYNLAELGFGVTTIFDPASRSSYEPAVTWSISQRDGFVGPTVYGSATVVMGYTNSARWMDVESYEHALVLASDIAGRGGLMIKSYAQGTRQQRQWLALAARATGLGVTPHEDNTPNVTLPLVADGFTAVEHEVSWEPLGEDAKQFLIESRVSLTPTLVVQHKALVQLAEPSLSDRRRDCLVDPTLVVADSDTAQKDFTAKDISADYADLLNRGARVTIGAHGEAPGLDFHWELELLSMGGATPMNLLKAATMNGAEKLGLDRRIGSLVKGKDADFVVLDANPLEDIRNARNIGSVVRRGQVLAWPAGPAPQSWKSATAWDACQRWNFGLDSTDPRTPNLKSGSSSPGRPTKAPTRNSFSGIRTHPTHASARQISVAP